MNSSISAIKARLAEHIARGSCDKAVVYELLPEGQGLQTEKALWDYKREFPSLDARTSPTDEDRLAHNAKIAGLVKDIVSFYNSYGGYIVAGVDDRTRAILGFDRDFSPDDLQKRARAATGHDIDCNYVVHQVDTPEGSAKVGLLYIPKRSYSLAPAQFRRDAPKPPGGGLSCYKTNDIYLRIADECKPAQTAEEFTFLCGGARREISFADEFRHGKLLLNNLGARDPGFIMFVGRESYLRQLWRWVCDGFTPVKLLAGLGGVGKTTLAREFAEGIVKNPPDGTQKLIWLSAKKRFYTAIRGKFEPTTRVDFLNTKTLLTAILLELGTPEKHLDTEWTAQELEEQVTQALRLFPSVLIVDDVDSLDSTEQQDVFQTLIQITAETMGRDHAPSLALLTARLDLGCAPRQLLRVTGLELPDFAEYCKMTADAWQIPFNIRATSPLMRKFHQTTDGSPTFAASILRLVEGGANLDSVLSTWKGRDGDEVRRFAFEKELDQLSESQIRTLYAACLLGQTSFVELQTILSSGDRLLSEDIAALRKYHLVTLSEDMPGGARIVIPSALLLMMDMIGKRVRDPHRLEHACVASRKVVPQFISEVGQAIGRVAALWHENKQDDALQVALVTDRRFPNNPDVKCLLGRALLLVVPADPTQAELQFRRAYELKCVRHELASLWLQAKAMREDWVGILDISKLFEQDVDNILSRAWAYLQLGDIALKSGNLRRATEQWTLGLNEIDRPPRDVSLRGKEIQAGRLARDLHENLIYAQNRLLVRPGDRLQVWQAVVAGVRHGVNDVAVLRLGVNALSDWWGGVEQRKRIDNAAVEIMLDQLRRLDILIAGLRGGHQTDPGVIESFESSRLSLYKRVQELDVGNEYS
ncbi:MAG: RNA-binding domain-containing protein [Terracidiphilus sp.]